MATLSLPTLDDLKTPSAPFAVDGPLTRREREVLELVAQGASNKAIAGDLFVSHNTVKTHLRNIREKLNLISMRQVVAYAARVELVESDRLPPA